MPRCAAIGDDVTVLTYGGLVQTALAAADLAAEHYGWSLEVVDLRSLNPLDFDTVAASVRKTGRAVVVHEGARTLGFGAELAAQIQEELFYDLEAPVLRATGFDTPYPPARLEKLWLPGVDRLIDCVEKAMQRMSPDDVRDFLVPDLGEGLEDATITSWSVAVGDDVDLNQTLCTVETNKAEVEIPARTRAGSSNSVAQKAKHSPSARCWCASRRMRPLRSRERWDTETQAGAGRLRGRRRDGHQSTEAVADGTRPRAKPRCASSPPTCTSTWPR